MERASLYTVPLRPLGPVDPDAALAHVSETLPALDEEASRLLSLVDVAGRARAATAAELELDEARVADALARGRKALRRSMFPLSASGWCERAERLISNRLDGPLAAPGPALLSAHLGNCERCVEHERRLAQSRDTLVRTFIEKHPAHDPEPPPAEPAQPEAPELRVVDPDAPTATPAPAPAAPPVEAAPAMTVPAAAAQHEAVAAALPKATLRDSAARLFWRLMFALAVVLALVTIALTALSATGVLDV